MTVSTPWEWLLLAALAAAFNVTPVLAPPTIAVPVYFHLNHGLGILPLAIIGALGAALDRLVLAIVSRTVGARMIPEKRRASIDRVAAALQSRRSLALPGLALFAVGPIPKGTLFIAAGLARIPLLPGTVVFGVTRFGIYLASLIVAENANSSLGDVFGASVAGSPGIIGQIASLGVMLLIFRYDWSEPSAHLARIEARLRGSRARLLVTGRAEKRL